MTSGQTKLLEKLIKLGEIDAQLAGILADNNKREAALSEKRTEVGTLEVTLTDLRIALKQEQDRYRKEENRLRDENDKLVERRKALNSFSDYKVQQSAQKEIEQSSKQLAAHEEKLITGLDHAGELEKELKGVEESFETGKAELVELESDTKSALAELESRKSDKIKMREDIVSTIDSKDLTIYNRIRTRHVANPIVHIENNACAGCHMQVGAQVLVQVSRADNLIKCRGCGRILYLKQEASAEAEAS